MIFSRNECHMCASLTEVKRFKPNAVVSAPPVAITYDVNNCLPKIERKMIEEC